MFDKIKNLPKSSFWQNLRDVRFLGFVLFTIMVLLATWSGITVIETNYELQKEIAQLDETNKVQELSNTNLELQNEYYNTDTYLELTARRQLGRGAVGEKLLLVPKEVALTHAKELPEDVEQASKEAGSSNQPAYQQNFNAWMDFLFRRSS